MGIPGIFKEIGKGERVALSKFAIEHFERTNRPLRIAIDAAIWNFQNAASQGGRNPALRTLFFRLLKLLALPIHPVFVYDGSKRPLTKRGKTVSRYGTCIENEMAKQLLSQFKFPHHTAPGEAEAECAVLQKNGIVDAVMSQDVDAIMFGSRTTMRDWSKEGTYGNKSPTHVSILEADKVKERSGLDPDAMILVALLSGGDYDDGVSGFGSTLACEIAKAGFGSDLLKFVRDQDEHGIREWKERLCYELETNESGYFRRRHLKLKLPDSFPDRRVLEYYVTPCVSKLEELDSLEKKWKKQWNTELDIPTLHKYTATMFDWNWKSGARRFVRCVAQPLFQNRLQRGLVQPSMYSWASITGDRKHFVADGMVEFRFSAVPAHVVDLDVEAEEDNPELIASQVEEENAGDEEMDMDQADTEIHPTKNTTSNTSRPKRMPWDPYSPEKWWVPATLLKIGLGSIVEEWEQQQREIMTDPRRFATRKCAKPVKAVPRIDEQMRSGAIRGFLTQCDTITNNEDYQAKAAIVIEDSPGAKPLARHSKPRTPSKRRPQAALEGASPTITRFFKPHKIVNPLCSLSKTLERTSKEPNNGLTENRLGSSGGQGILDFAALSEVMQPETSTTGLSKKPSAKGEVQACPPRLVRSEDLLGESLSNHSNITKRSRRKLPKPDPSEISEAITHKSTSIEYAYQFFNTEQRTTVINVADQAAQKKKKPSKVLAVARESLPGTWKELDSVTQIPARAARVSYVDLSGV